MNDKQNQNLGEQILNAVDDILASGNFDKLNSAVSDTVYKALDEVQKQFSKTASESREQEVYVSKKRCVSGRQTGKRPMPTRVRLRRVGSVSGVLWQVFGGIGAGILGLVFLIILIDDGFYYAASWLVPFLLSIGMTKFGREKRKRLARADRYLYVMQGESYMNLSDLAHLTNMTEKQVRKDLKKMIKLGIFPEGHLDWNEKCLMLNDTAYREYLRLEKQRKALETQEQEQSRQIPKQNQQADTQQVKQQPPTEENKELLAMIEEGNRCIRQLRDLNDAIEGEVISAKLFRLENLLKEIFEQVQEHPEKIPQMHKFMDYYLPTTLKLVQAYEEFDDVSVAGKDILSAKAEIEKTLDTINMAFAELLNRLFRDRAFDASADAQVLKTMLAREGLTKEPMFAENCDVNIQKEHLL